MSVGLAAAAPATAGNLSPQPYPGQPNLPPSAQTSEAGYGGSDQVWQSNAPLQPYPQAATPDPTSKHPHKHRTPLYASIAAATTAAVTLVLWLLLRKRGTKGRSKTATSSENKAAAETAQSLSPVQPDKQNEIKGGEKAASVPAEKTPVKASQSEYQIGVSKPLGGDTRISTPPHVRLPLTLFSARVNAGLVILTLMGAAYFKPDSLRAGMKLAGPAAIALRSKVVDHLQEAKADAILFEWGVTGIGTAIVLFKCRSTLKMGLSYLYRAARREGASSATEDSVTDEADSSHVGVDNVPR